MKKQNPPYSKLHITLEITSPGGRKYLEKFRVTLAPQEASIVKIEGRVDISIRFEFSLTFHIENKVSDFFTNRGWTGKWKAYSSEVAVGGKVYTSTNFSYIGNLFTMVV